jgi:histidinol-phosphate aminotransferase
MAERGRLFDALRRFDFLKLYRSHANFILCRVVKRDAFQLKHTLESHGILVRYFDKPGLRDCIRISVGTPEQSEALIASLIAMSE